MCFYIIFKTLKSRQKAKIFMKHRWRYFIRPQAKLREGRALHKLTKAMVYSRGLNEWGQHWSYIYEHTYLPE